MKPRDPLDVYPGSARAVWMVGLGAILGLLGLFILASVSFADEKPMPSFTQDCRPALEVLGELMMRKKELPWKAGKVGDTEVVITYNEQTRSATFLAVCEQELLTGGDMHKPMSSRVVKQLRVMFPLTLGNVDLSSLPWVHA